MGMRSAKSLRADQMSSAAIGIFQTRLARPLPKMDGSEPATWVISMTMVSFASSDASRR